MINGTSVSRSLAMLKCSRAKSSGVSSYEYHLREMSLAPIGMRQRVKLAPPPGANSSRRMPSRSSASRAASEVQPSSLKLAPNPSITCRGLSVRTITFGTLKPVSTASSLRMSHGAVWVVMTHVTSFAAVRWCGYIKVLLSGCLYCRVRQFGAAAAGGPLLQLPGGDDSSVAILHQDFLSQVRGATWRATRGTRTETSRTLVQHGIEKG